MDLDKEVEESQYRMIRTIEGKRNICIVQRQGTHEVFVKKQLQVYEPTVFRYLKTEKFRRIPKITEVTESEGTLLVIEEYIHGRNLEKVLEERLFSEAEVRTLMLQLCRILRQLHEHEPKIIHRDIKPSNLILARDQLWLIDFDAAREYVPDKSRDTNLIGTQGYAAPEQFGFSQTTPRTDIYAIGVLMNEMLTGRMPADQHAGGSLQGIIRRCTAMDPQRRYPDVKALAEALRGETEESEENGGSCRCPDRNPERCCLKPCSCCICQRRRLRSCRSKKVRSWMSAAWIIVPWILSVAAAFRGRTGNGTDKKFLRTTSKEQQKRI